MSSYPERARTLRQSELLRLDRFLHSAGSGGEAMNLSRAHGFLTAGAAGPEELESAEWLRLMFDEPVFASGEEAQEILGIALRLYHDIERGLAETGGFRPVLDFVGDGAGTAHPDAAAWCQGFLSGMNLFREHWTGADRTVLHEPLALIYQLSQTPPAGDFLYRRLCDALPAAAEAVYRHWRQGCADPGSRSGIAG